MKLRVTKLDAAKRQLELAVWLYAGEGDPVSTHTLACAAREIIRRINRSMGGAPTIRESLKDRIKPTHRRRVYDKLNAPRNFFVHCTPGQEHKAVDLLPWDTHVVMLDACWTYRRISAERVPAFAAFEAWAELTWAKTFIDRNVDGKRRALLEQLANLGRLEFFTTMVAAGATAAIEKSRAT